MVTVTELKQLQAQKIILLAKGQIYRSTFQFEYERLRERLGWVQRSASFVRKTYPFFILAAPLAGFLIMRRRRKRPRRGSKLALAWQIARYAWPLAKPLLSRKPRD